MDRVVMNTDPNAGPTPEQQAHDAAMAAKMEAGTGTKPDEGQETLLAGKYKTEEDLQKGIIELLKKQHGNLEDFYKGLESRIGEQKPDESKPEPTEEKKPDEKKSGNNQFKVEVKEAETILEKAGLNLEDFNKEFAQNGELSEESYEKLTKAGFPKAMVDAYIEGQKAIAERVNQSIFSRVGGEDNYRKMLTWAKDNLSQEDIAAYNSVFDTNDIKAMELAVDGLYARFSNHRPPNLVEGTTKASAGDSFQSWSQVTAAMKDPRYGRDPVYTKDVETKLGRSKL